jgi:hypothetical protein
MPEGIAEGQAGGEKDEGENSTGNRKSSKGMAGCD